MQTLRVCVRSPGGSAPLAPADGVPVHRAAMDREALPALHNPPEPTGAVGSHPGAWPCGGAAAPTLVPRRLAPAALFALPGRGPGVAPASPRAATCKPGPASRLVRAEPNERSAVRLSLAYRISNAQIDAKRERHGHEEEGHSWEL